MSGIAELLCNLGYAVSGSDAKRSEVTDRLSALGVRVDEGHAASHVGDADVVVFSSAVRQTNPEIVEATRRRIPVIARAEMLAELMRLRYGICIAGAHGKTTTTSMIALALERGGLDPTAVVGGRLSAFGSNARLGSGDYMVAEADESDRSFLKLTPTIAVITNVDHEHMDTYGSFAELQQAFVDFANKVPFYGVVVACGDDPELAAILPRMTRRRITYGFLGDADIVGSDPRVDATGSSCRVARRVADGTAGPQSLGTLRLQVPGHHNLLNALAAVAVGLDLGLEFAVIADALAGFQGAERRFQRFGEPGGVLIVDDYGHHPTEIAAVLGAARAALNRRLVVAFQPHRYSRTAQLMDAFGPALGEADELVLADIYAAGEDPIPGVTSDALAAAIERSTGRPVHRAHTLDEVVATVVRLARPGDAVITLGAGSIGTVARRLVDALGAAGGGRH